MIARIRFALLTMLMLPFGVAVMAAMLVPIYVLFVPLRDAIALDAALYVGSVLAVAIYAVPFLADAIDT